MKQISSLIVILILIAAGCNTIKETSKQQMEPGIFYVKSDSVKPFYVQVQNDTIVLHYVIKSRNSWIGDTIRRPIIITGQTLSIAI